jgi:hypothetical protein
LQLYATVFKQWAAGLHICISPCFGAQALVQPDVNVPKCIISLCTNNKYPMAFVSDWRFMLLPADPTSSSHHHGLYVTWLVLVHVTVTVLRRFILSLPQRERQFVKNHFRLTTITVHGDIYIFRPDANLIFSCLVRVLCFISCEPLNSETMLLHVFATGFQVVAFQVVVLFT